MTTNHLTKPVIDKDYLYSQNWQSSIQGTIWWKSPVGGRTFSLDQAKQIELDYLQGDGFEAADDL